MPFGCFKKKDDSEDRKSFFVITTIFNPASFRSRYDLYRQFASHMKETNVQLITIECIFPSLNQHAYQVTDSKNPYHIQLKSKSIYWMKENLINIAVQRLPSHAKWVCWLDADIHFTQKNWVSLTIKELEKYLVVQVFKKANYLSPSPKNEVLRTYFSFGYAAVHWEEVDQTMDDEWLPYAGYGWAMDVDAFRKIGGLPNFDIVGSGDLHFALSLIYQVSNKIDDTLHPEYKKLILTKSRETPSTLENMARVQGRHLFGYVPITINHNWHGSRKDRQCVKRWNILVNHRFNFKTDMKRNSDGLLEFVEKVETSSHTNSRTIQEDILTYFQNRKEDEKTCIVADNVAVQNGAMRSEPKKLEPKKVKLTEPMENTVVPKIPNNDKPKSSDGSFKPTIIIPEIVVCLDEGDGDNGGCDRSAVDLPTSNHGPFLIVQQPKTSLHLKSAVFE